MVLSKSCDQRQTRLQHSPLPSSPGAQVAGPGDPIFCGEWAVSTEKRFFVYIMASRPWGTLYIGVTSDLFRRVFEHREGLIEGFTKTYGVKTLVHFEEWPTSQDAIHREKRLKKWPRIWKINLIRTDNPEIGMIWQRSGTQKQ